MNYSKITIVDHVFYREKSEKQLKREAKKAEKQAKKAQYKGQGSDGQTVNDAAQAAAESAADAGEDVAAGKYGDSGMNQSKEKSNIRLIEDFSILTEKLGGQNVWVRGRLHTSRAKGTLSFRDQN